MPRRPLLFPFGESLEMSLRLIPNLPEFGEVLPKDGRFILSDSDGEHGPDVRVGNPVVDEVPFPLEGEWLKVPHRLYLRDVGGIGTEVEIQDDVRIQLLDVGLPRHPMTTDLAFDHRDERTLRLESREFGVPLDVRSVRDDSSLKQAPGGGNR
jgi:hypothetical protein